MNVCILYSAFPVPILDMQGFSVCLVFTSANGGDTK